MPKRQTTSIDHPIFGPISPDEDGNWNGLIRLPLFAQYDEKSMGDVTSDVHSRMTRQEKRRAERFAAALFPLQIIGFADDDGPATAQEEAFRFLVEHESQVVDAIMAHIFRMFSSRDGYWTLDGKQYRNAEFELREPGELKQLMRLSTVCIEPSGDDIADVSFYFCSTLDEEHGIEVVTNRTDVEGDSPDVFPFDLPEGLDAVWIEPEPAGHRFVEFKSEGKWHGIYVLDEGLKCDGRVAGSLTSLSPRDQIHSPDQIEDIRAVTRWHKWLASPARETAMQWLAASNWFVSLPCLLVAWAWLPQLFWATLVLSVLCIIGTWLLKEWQFMPVVQAVVAMVGLVYASNSPDFGNDEHVTEVVAIYGSIVWWSVVAVDALAITVFVFLIASFRTTVLREGLDAVFPALLFIIALTSGLAASHYGFWSPFQLLWLTPLAFVTSFAILLIGMLTGFLSFSKRCPKCGEPLRTPRAKQCLACGADWH